MLDLFKKWLNTLNEIESDLRNQGYIVVCGGGGLCLVCWRESQGASPE